MIRLIKRLLFRLLGEYPHPAPYVPKRSVTEMYHRKNKRMTEVK